MRLFVIQIANILTIKNMELFVLFLDYRNSFYIQDTRPLSETCCENIFS